MSDQNGTQTATRDTSATEREIGRLQAENERLKRDLETSRRGKGNLAKQLETANGELAKLREQVDASPDSSAKTISGLQAKVRTLTHREAFNAQLAAAKVRKGVTVEDLWTMAGYTPEADTIDAKGVEAVMAKAKAAKSWLFEDDAPAGDQSGTHQPQTAQAGTQAAGNPNHATVGQEPQTTGSLGTMRNPTYLQQTPAAQAGSGQPGYPFALPAGPGMVRGGGPDTTNGVITVSRASLSDPAFMEANQARIAEAGKKGLVNWID